MTSHILTITCPSKSGIVATIASQLAELGCNISDSAQYDDPTSEQFFMRIRFDSETGTSHEALGSAFSAMAGDHDMRIELHRAEHRMKIVVMVSRFGHCLNDLLYRWRIGALPIDIVAVISNHMEYQKLVVNHDIPFHCIPVTPQNKPDAEARILEVVEQTGAELIVLARYMQILSDAMCARMDGRIINIHHSFLPSFKGANPYKQAFERGVKLIGATSHYVSKDLDEGPIIAQSVIPVTHAQSAEDYVALGRDVEATVLARALHAHAHHRVFRNGGRTVVFPASPGSYASLRMG